MCTEFKEKLAAALKASLPLIQITTPEETRVTRAILQVLKQIGTYERVYSWSATGLKAIIDDNMQILEQASRPAMLLEALENNDYFNSRAALLMYDVAAFDLENYPDDNRALREIVLRSLPKRTVISVGARHNWPAEIERMAHAIDWPLPDSQHFSALIDSYVQQVKTKRPEITDHLFDNTSPWEIQEALRGLTHDEAAAALSLSLAQYQRFNRQFIVQQKAEMVKRTGLLEVLHTDEHFDQSMGGYEQFRKWVRLRTAAYSEKARKFGIRPPKGVLLLGLPGTGKTLATKCIASELELPLLRMDIGSLMGSLVGQSEERTRQALKLIESIGQCIVLLDEIEKGFAGARGGDNDGGVVRRILGAILEFMQDRNNGAFFAATCNDITSLPPELLRKGRFDELFFFDLPDKDERKSILQVHLRKVNRDPSQYNLNSLSNLTKGFVGSEIEQAIQDALFLAFADGKELDDTYLKQAIANTKPLSRIAREQLDSLRRWAKGRCRLANSSTITSSDDMLDINLS